MVASTRARLERTLGAAEAARRVRHGRIDALGDLPDGAFELVLALGVLQHAGSEAAFDAAVATVARVLRPGGSALVAHFAPSSRPGGRALVRVRGTTHTYAGWGGPNDAAPMVLHEPDALDAAFASAWARARRADRPGRAPDRSRRPRRRERAAPGVGGAGDRERPLRPWRGLNDRGAPTLRSAPPWAASRRGAPTRARRRTA